MFPEESDRPYSCYVYYRMRANTNPEQARERIRGMQRILADRFGLTCRLMNRREDEQTLMEVYEGVTDPNHFETALQDAVEAAHLHDLIEPGSARHLERFVECA